MISVHVPVILTQDRVAKWFITEIDPENRIYWLVYTIVGFNRAVTENNNRICTLFSKDLLAPNFARYVVAENGSVAESVERHELKNLHMHSTSSDFHRKNPVKTQH